MKKVNFYDNNSQNKLEIKISAKTEKIVQKHRKLNAKLLEIESELKDELLKYNDFQKIDELYDLYDFSDWILESFKSSDFKEK